MSIYDDLLGNVKDKMIDGVVDGAIDSVKGKATLSTTYVWTCINKETHGGNIVNLTFINKLGQRKRVPFDKLGDFCASNYVSNVVVSEGKVNMVGCTLSDLPNFKLMSNGQYDCVAIHDENWIYNKAFPYIQSQERLIQEDYKNKCLKSNEKPVVQSNITGNISAIKDISTATAVTAVTAAGAATVAGAVVAGKAIYTQVNKKKVVEEQEKICRVLKNYDELIRAMVLMKYKTNSMYENDKELITYNNDIEVRNETTGKLNRELQSMGVVGCVQKALNGLETCRSKAKANKILDLPLKISGVNFGTIEAYINSLQNSVENVKQLHLETKTLMDKNIQLKNQAEYNRRMSLQREQEQNNLINDINTELNNLTSIVDSYMTMNIDSNNVNYIPDSFDRNLVLERINNISIKSNNIDDNIIRDNIKNSIATLNDNVRILRENILNFKHNESIQFRNEINQSLSEAEQSLESLVQGTYIGGDYLNAMNSITACISTSKMKLNSLSDIDKDIISSRIKALEDKTSLHRRTINDNIKNMEKQQSDLDKLDLDIDRYRRDISNASKARDINDMISNFSRVTNNSIYGIKNTTLLEQAKSKINNAKQEFEEIYQLKLNEETEKENNKKQVINDIIQRIDEKITYIKKFSAEVITEETIGQLSVPSEDSYRELLEDYNITLDESRKIRNKYNDLSKEVSKKTRDYRNIILDEQSACNFIRNSISIIENAISRLDRISKDSVNVKIRNLENDNHVRKLQNREWFNAEMERLNTLYNSKIAEIE